MLENLIGIKPQYIKERNNKYLIIWRDIPNWIVVDKELLDIIKKFDSKTTLDNIFGNGHKIAPLKNIISKFIELGIVFNKNEGMKIRKIEDKLEEVSINITLRCNLRCKLCYNKDAISLDEELSINEIKQFLDETLKFGSDKNRLAILGGEPLLVTEKTLETARYAKKIGYKGVDIITNGTLITREFAKEAKKIGLNIQVSLDGIDEKTNDENRGKGSFKKIIEGINILKEEGIHSVISMIYHSKNFHIIEDYYKFAISLGVDEARFAPLKYIGGGKDFTVKRVPYPEMIKCTYQMYKKHPEYIKIAGRDHFSTLATACNFGSTANYCGTALRVVLLDSDGEIYPCVNHRLSEFKAGNIRKDSFKNIWLNSPVLKKLREVYPVNNRNIVCSKCPVKQWCLGGCRGETYQVTNSLTARAIDCKDIRKGIIEMFWLLSGDSSYCE